MLYTYIVTVPYGLLHLLNTPKKTHFRGFLASKEGYIASESLKNFREYEIQL